MEKFCKNSDGFDAKYDLTMFFLREAKEEEDFDSLCTMDLTKMNEKVALAWEQAPKKDSNCTISRQFLLYVEFKFSIKIGNLGNIGFRRNKSNRFGKRSQNFYKVLIMMQNNI